MPPVTGLPPFSRAALLLDLDGTLLDIAPRPDAVIVAPGLPETLVTLRDALGGALAIVSGRPIAQIDALLPGIPTAIAGEHGGAYRHVPGSPIEEAALPHPPAEWLAAAADIARCYPGVVLEHKSHGFVLHYRAVPELGSAVRDLIAPLLAGSREFVVMPARKAWEIKPLGADKGVAVGRLMERPPFAGRLPIFIGDDVTDEDGIARARAMEGSGLRVPDTFGNPNGVRAWLAASAAEGQWAAL
jgi:trehalose 6-phosphate phosphatase